MIIGQVVPSDFWKLLEPHFRDFEDRTKGNVLANELRNDCDIGQRQCWVAFRETDTSVRGVCITQIAGHGPRVHVEYCNGIEAEEWRDDMLNAVEKFARKQGAQGVTITHRPGWRPFFHSRGYMETHRVSEVDFG